MPFREKVKKVFGRSTSASTSSLTTTSTNNTSGSSRKFKKSKKPEAKKYPANVYKPGEAMPPPKYRAPTDKKHEALLSAFSFSGALEMVRRKSGVSQYSPHGSRMPSRMGSRASARPETASRGPSRGASLVPPEGLEEVEGDGEEVVGNVEPSQHHAPEGTRHPVSAGKDKEDGESLKETETITLASGGAALPGEDLTEAMTTATVRPVEVAAA